MSATTTDHAEAIAALTATVEELREELRELYHEFAKEMVRRTQERIDAIDNPPGIHIHTRRRWGTYQVGSGRG